MDPNAAANFILDLTRHSSSSSSSLNHHQREFAYNLQTREEEDHSSSSAIDLGLSLKTMDPRHFYPSSNPYVLPEAGYPPPPAAPPHNFITANPYYTLHHNEEEAEAVQSKHRGHYPYLKVNMDGVPVGRKICITSQDDYSSLALQLDDMFGRFTSSREGLRLFENESKFALVYKDVDGKWRVAGDVIWQDFVDCAKRLRIVKKDERCFL